MKFFSLGPDCNTARQLQNHGLRSKAGPLDWVQTLQMPLLWRPLLDGTYGILDGLCLNARDKPTNAYRIEFTHHDVINDPEAASSMERRMTRLRDDATSGDTTLVSQVSLFGDNAPNLADAQIQGIQALREFLPPTTRTSTAIRVPAAPSGIIAQAACAVASGLTGLDLGFLVVAPAPSGFDPSGTWGFLDLLRRIA